MFFFSNLFLQEIDIFSMLFLRKHLLHQMILILFFLCFSTFLIEYLEVQLSLLEYELSFTKGFLFAAT